MNTKNKKSTKINPFRLFIVIFVAVFIIIGIAFLLFINLPSYKQMAFRQYFNYSEEIVTVQDDEYRPTEHTPKFIDDNIYISFDYVKEHIDKYIYWDNELGKLTITNSDEVIKFKEEETTYFVNDEPFSLDLPVTIIDGAPYIPKSLIESLYNYEILYKDSTNILLVKDLSKMSTYAQLKSNTTLRYEANKKGVIEDKIKKGETVQIFDQYDKYTKIVMEDGKVGYIKTNEIGQTSIVEGVEEKQDTYVTKPIDGPIIMVWDNITNTDANRTKDSKVLHEGLNVLSPTWFKFDRQKLDGTIISYADIDYVNYAHQNGYMVWGLVSDVADSYDSVITSSILPNSDYRETAIKQLLSYMSIYNLDGLNIDIEMLNAEDSDSYVQFFRELYPYMKAEGKYLSVDVYVPSAWTEHFRREDVAKSVDYFCMMSYDEHTSAEKIGPVASIDFVEKSIVDSLELMPKEKLVLGIPFYTRIWKTEIIDGKVVDSKVGDYGLDTAMKRFEENSATTIYDSKTGYNYSEYTTIEDGNAVTYKAWLEDDKSLQQKVELVNKYQIKGVAGWRRGLQSDTTFSMINDTIN